MQVLKRWKGRRELLCVTLGVAIGAAMMYVVPRKPLQAVATDRSDKFAIVTAPVDTNLEAVFVLDFLTGRLTGAVLDRTGTRYTMFYTRDLAADFNVDPQVTPQYAIVSGRSLRPSVGRAQWGNSSIYVAELTSGQVACYAIPYRNTTRPEPAPIPLVPVVTFPFREALK
ncbi:MAG: hypothetical protein D6725_16985 [Planctomycetota bacterium]|nr:MAG: hypothetical protein D6725_16985 [Planctomycetota bacterium]